MKFQMNQFKTKTFNELPSNLRNARTIGAIIASIAKRNPKIAIPSITMNLFVRRYGDVKLKDVPSTVLKDVKDGVLYIQSVPKRVKDSVRETGKTLSDSGKILGSRLQQAITKLIADKSLDDTIDEYHNSEVNKLKEDIKARWKAIWNDPSWYDPTGDTTLLRNVFYNAEPYNTLSHTISLGLNSITEIESMSLLATNLTRLIQDYFITLGTEAPEGFTGTTIIEYVIKSAQLYGLLLWLHKSQNCKNVTVNGRNYARLLSGSWTRLPLAGIHRETDDTLVHTTSWIIGGGTTGLPAIEDHNIWSQFDNISNARWADMVQKVRSVVYLPIPIASLLKHLLSTSFAIFNDERENELVNFVPFSFNSKVTTGTVLDQITSVYNSLTQYITNYQYLVPILSLIGWKQPLINEDYTRDLHGTTFTISRDPLMLVALLNTPSIYQQNKYMLETQYTEEANILTFKAQNTLFNEEVSQTLLLGMIGELKKFSLLGDDVKVINAIIYSEGADAFEVRVAFRNATLYQTQGLPSHSDVISLFSNESALKHICRGSARSTSEQDPILPQYFKITHNITEIDTSEDPETGAHKFTTLVKRAWEGDTFVIPDYTYLATKLRSYLWSGMTDYEISHLQSLIGPSRLSTSKV